MTFLYMATIISQWNVRVAHACLGTIGILCIPLIQMVKKCNLDIVQEITR